MEKLFSLKCLLHIIVTAVVLHLLLNTKIMKFIITPEEEYRSNMRDDRIYIDMRRNQGYTDELEKLTRDDSGLAVVINLKEAAKNKMRLRITGFSRAEY